MRLSKKIGCWLVCAVALPWPVHAAFEDIYQVAQPLLVRLGESGVWIAAVPYLGYDLGIYDRPAAITLTVAPDSVLCDNRTENRNMAALLGIRFSIQRVPDGYGRMLTVLHGDTLQVHVEIPSVAKWPFDESEDDVICATLWCGLLNARQAWPAVRFVEYRVHGDATFDFRKYGGVFSLADLESHEGATRWSAEDKESLTRRCTPRAP